MKLNVFCFALCHVGKLFVGLSVATETHPRSSSHSQTLLCGICLAVTPIVVLAEASLLRPLYKLID